MGLFKRKGRGTALQRGDEAYLSAVRGATLVDAAPAAMWAIYLMLAVVFSAVAWAAVAQVDIVAKADGRVVPDGREQVIASLEGGILREMLVREGQLVQVGEELALLDPTRFEAQQAEGQAKRIALRGAVARLQAEATGRPLSFPPDVLEQSEVVEGETESFDARRRALDEAVGINRRNMALLRNELGVAERMSAQGLMSEVEVMRVRRQLNDLDLQTQERINRFRQDASAELVKLRTELSQVEEQMVVRDDALRRTILTSPVRGLVKQIKANTIGGVIAPGAPVMELVPVGERVLIEARIRPADIGFVKVGQPVVVKLSAYEYTVYGGLLGKVHTISPDALGDPERASTPGGTYYRALVLADSGVLRKAGKALEVLPGMTAMVEIRTGQRSVLGFVLRPLMKSQEAFRER
jgi:membrane fusion protein, adhesin transport system